MEEILASIRRIIADDQDGGRAAPPPIRSVPPPKPESEDVLDLAELRPPAPRLDLGHEDVSFREADNQVDFDAVPVDDGPEKPEAFEPPPPIRPAPAAAPAPASEPLLSNVANATVAGAFQKLSTTVLTSNPRTLEDLVQDMLRPMLKGWLDENLPPLVERLVRQEIERITRAGR